MIAKILIAIGIVWPLALVALVWSQLHGNYGMVGWGVDMPDGMPRWAVSLVFVLSLGIVLLGWVVPLAIGIRMRLRTN